MKPSEIAPRLRRGQRVRVSYEGEVVIAKGAWCVQIPGIAEPLELATSSQPVPVDVTLVSVNVWLRVKPAGVLHCVSFYHDGYARMLCEKRFFTSQLVETWPLATAACRNCKAIALNGS